MTAPAVLSNTSSSASTAVSNSMTQDNNDPSVGDDMDVHAANDDSAARVCYYCTHLKQLCDAVPPKRCDYCRVSKCQFCTLKFPLLNVRRKVLPKTLKSNSRICVDCFRQHWSAAADSSNESVDAKRASVAADARRSRESVLMLRRESMAIDANWAEAAAAEADGDAATSLPLSQRRLRSQRRAHSLSTLSELDVNVDASSALLPPAAAATTPPQTTTSIVSTVDIWISLFAATTLAAIVVLEGYSLQQRVCCVAAAYAVFLTLHPWFHHPRGDTTTTTPAAAATTAKLVTPPAPASTAATSATPQLPTTTTTNGRRALPLAYAQQRTQMQETLAFYLSDACLWKVVRTTTGGGVVSELAQNNSPFPVFKIELFLSGVPMQAFVDFLDSKDIAQRAKWDLNVAQFDVVETFEDAPHVSVCHNVQKSFLRGLVAARDFCLLYVRDGNCISFASVAHPHVPPRPANNVTRGSVKLSAFHCHEATSSTDASSGFTLTYICHVDIGGSLPPKLLYSGSIDNMVKMLQVFTRPQALLLQ